MHRKLSAFLSRHLIDRTGGHRRQVMAEFMDKSAFDFTPAEERERHQVEHLAALLNYARTTVPFYREILGGRPVITPGEARAVLAGLPLVSRVDLQRQPERFYAEGCPERFPDATGGSTGTPLRFVVDRATQRARESSLYWSDALAGWHYGDRIAMLWGSDKDVKSSSQQARANLRWWLDNRRWYNAFNMGEDRMAEFHSALTRFRPHIIVAYAGSMDVFAHYLRQLGPQPNYPLTSIISSAEMLTPSARANIEQVFGKPVFDRYGNREFGAIAAECSRHQGLHLNEHDFIIEIDSPDPVRQAGPLIVTYLHNRAMPFLRYQTGDLARLLPADACACGRNTRRLAAVTGRVADTIRTRDGKLIHGEFFTHLLYGASRIRQFQFVQETLTRYRLLLVCEGEEDPRVLDRIRLSILEEVGSDCEVVVERADSIPVLPSGKRKFTLSLVS